MESALGWVGAIVEWFGQLIPRWTIIGPTHGAIKYDSWKRKVYALAHGWHTYWPVRSAIHSHAIAQQSLDLRPQVVTTRDDKTVLIGLLITYEIDDIERVLAHTWDADETVKDSALSAAARVCLALTWEELKTAAQTGKLDIRLRSAARRVLTEYGVKVIKTTITDLAQTRVYKIVTSGNTIT